MSDSQALPQIQDESTELTFVDSDYLLNASGPEFGALFAVTSAHDVDPWLRLNSLTYDAASLDSLADQEGMFDMAADEPSPTNDFDFAIIGMDPHLNNTESTEFELDPSLPSLSVHDLPEPSNEMYPGYVSLSGSPSTTDTL
ncbi:hypothetical protein BKA59DRAFT_191968 [Fusarium tricinctum]|uniref:Uncharacterized protein n=1 Tax=Fusarium tricinctum TaxID=61284 RepID=A0A8K0WBJ8_9HYPO|nr:hypothetical protein BKA59DRAFT_191968 [Fusarium tricinctum]